MKNNTLLRPFCYLFFTFLIFLGGNLYAQLLQKNEPQELIDLVNKMQLNYPRLKEIQNQMNMANIRTDITRNQNKPVVNGDLSYRYVAPSPKLPFNGQSFQIAPNSNYNAGVSFSQAIYDFGRLKVAIAKGEQEEKNLQNNYDISQLNLGYQVANVYYNILFLNKSMLIKEAEIEQIKAFKDLTEKRIKDGDALEYEAISTQVRLNNALNQKTDLQNTLQKQIILLNSLTGINNANLAGKIVELSRMNILGNADALVSSAKANNKEIKNNEDRILVAMKDYEMAKKFFYPNVIVSGAAGFKNGYVPDVNVIMPNYNIGIGATIPIYAGDRNKKQILLAKANADSYKATIETLENNLTKDIQLQLSDIQTTSEKYKTVDTQIQQAQQAYDLANNRYRNGVLKSIDLTDAQTNLIVVQLQRIQYEYQLILAQLELKRLLGEKFW